MNKSEFRKQLAGTVPAAPAVFDRAVQIALDDIAANGPRAAGKPRRGAGGYKRRALVVTLAAVLLAAVAALAASLLGLNVFEGTIGDSPVNADRVIQYDLAKVSYNECDIEIRQAAYDGMTLFVVYSIRERNAEEILGEWDEKQKAYIVSDEVFPAMERDGIGYWYDGLWINGEYVAMPQMSSQIAYGSEVPGELLYYYMYRLDQEDIVLDGKAVEIALAIGKHPPLEDREYDKQTGGLILPIEGLITFTLDCSARSGIAVEHPRIPTVLDDFTVEAKDVTYSPIQLYITLSLHANPGAMEAYIAEHGEGALDDDGNIMWPYSEIDLYENWTRGGLKLVDGGGNPVYKNGSLGGMYGMFACGNDEAWFTFPYLEEYPDEMYLAPVRGGAADMAQAVRVK